MTFNSFKSVAFLLVLAMSATGAASDVSKQITISFDDAPRGAGALLSGEERTRMLIESLAAGGIDEAIFFATTGNLVRRGESGAVRLRQYTAAGHVLANHSHAHQSANQIEPGAFLADVAEAQTRLAEFENMTPYFRFPFLHEGNTPERRDAIRTGLTELGLKNGYVTIDNYDYYLQALFDEAVKSKRPMDLAAWRSVYVEVLMAAVRFYDGLALETLGRSPVHSLLLHENDLAALFIDDLAAALRAEGWDIVPARAAYDDKIAEAVPDTLLLGQGRVAAIAATQGKAYRDLIHPYEGEPELRALLVKRGLVDLAQGAYLGRTSPGLTPEKFAPDLVSLDDRYEYGQSFSADGRELYFGVAVDGRGSIHQMRYSSEGWTEAEPILTHPVYSYADPFLSRDRTRLYFISTEPSKGPSDSATYDIGFVQRQREGWSEPVFLDSTINSASSEYYVSFADDGALVFASDVLAEREHDFDIFMAAAHGDSFASPEQLAGRINTRAYEADPFIAPDGRYVLFSSTRRSGAGMRDIYAAFQLDDGSWSQGVSLGIEINTPELEFCPFVTRDGRFLFYTSNEDLYWVDAGVIDLAYERLQAMRHSE